MVGFIVWRLVAGSADRPDLLIAVDQSEGVEGVSRREEIVRHWIHSHLEAYWTYAWILLAPYVVGLSLRWALDRKDLGWRLMLHLLLGAGFITASQALTRRLDSLRPRAIRIKREGVVSRADPQGTNDPANLRWTHAVEWRKDPLGEGAGSREVSPFGGTPPPILETSKSPRVFIWNETVDVHGAVAAASTNAPASSGSPQDFARRLAPMIEAELKAGFGPVGVFGPRRFSAALDGLAYLTLIGLAQAIHFRRRLGERETQAAALEARLVQSRLHALQAQLQPHFLFNALNGIATLVRRDPRMAEEMLGSLSELLRASLSGSGRQEISLREELDFLERYLELQLMRFGDRLTVERDVAPEALDCLVPSLVLQPLVENAIRHGIEPSAVPGWVRIAARCAGADLILEVEDNGVGLAGSPPGSVAPGGGLGLVSVRERLTGLYGGRQEFQFQPRPGGVGVAVRIRIPARPADAAAPRVQTGSNS